MELLHTQIQIEWPETFLILKTKRKRNAELSNSPVKTCKLQGKLSDFKTLKIDSNRL